MSSKTNPMAMTLTRHSRVNTVVNSASVFSMTAFPPGLDGGTPVHPRPSIFSGSIWQSTIAFAMMKSRMTLSNHGFSLIRMHATRRGWSSSKYPSERSEYLRLNPGVGSGSSSCGACMCASSSSDWSERSGEGGRETRGEGVR